MKHLLVSWAANAITLAVVALVLSRVTVQDAGALLIAAAVFGVLNTLVKPVLKLLSLPLAVITVGIAWLSLSLLMIELTSLISSGFEVPRLRDPGAGDADRMADEPSAGSRSGTLERHALRAR